MFCRDCRRLRPSQRSGCAGAPVGHTQWATVLSLFCSGCGAALANPSLHDQWAALNRQLDAFGLGSDGRSGCSSPMPH